MRAFGSRRTFFAELGATLSLDALAVVPGAVLDEVFADVFWAFALSNILCLVSPNSPECRIPVALNVACLKRRIPFRLLPLFIRGDHNLKSGDALYFFSMTR